MAIKNRGLSPRQQALLKQARKNLISRTARVWSKLGRSLFGDLNGIAQAWVGRVMQTARKNVATGYLDAIPSMPRSFERGLRDGLVYALVQGYWLEHIYMKECEAAMQEKLYHVPADDAVKARLQKMTKYELELADIEWDSVGPEAAIEWLKGYTPKLAGKLEDDVLKKVNNAIIEGMREGLPLQERVKAIQELSPKLASMAKTRVEAIVRTEITRADTMGRLTEMKSNPDVLGVEFSAILDGRTTVMCDHRHGLVMRLDDPRLPFNTPPMHISCRSVLLPCTVFEHPDGLLTSHEFDDAPDGIQRPEDIALVAEVLGQMHPSKTKEFGVISNASSEPVDPVLAEAMKKLREEKPTPENIDKVNKEIAKWKKEAHARIKAVEKTDVGKKILEAIEKGVHNEQEAIALGSMIREAYYTDIVKYFERVQETIDANKFKKSPPKGSGKIRDAAADRMLQEFPNQFLVALLERYQGAGSVTPVCKSEEGQDNSAAVELVKRAALYLPNAWVERALVSNESTNFIVTLLPDTERAHANASDIPVDGKDLNQVYLNADNLKTAIHELTHIFEARIKAIGDIGRQHLKSRVVNEELVSLLSLFPNSKYKETELTRRDKFLDVYMGRDYAAEKKNELGLPQNINDIDNVKHTEIMSMGIPAMLFNEYNFWYTPGEKVLKKDAQGNAVTDAKKKVVYDFVGRALQSSDEKHLDAVLGAYFGAKVEAAAQPRLTYKDITVGIVPEQNENATIRGVLVDDILFNRGEAGHSKVSVTPKMMQGFYESAGIGFTDAATKEIFGVALSDAEAKARVEALKAYTGNAHRAMWEAYDKSQRGEKLTKTEQKHLEAYNLVAEAVQVMPTYQKADKDPKELFLGVKDGEYAGALKQLGDGMILNLQHVTTVTSSLDSAKEFAGKETNQSESGKVNQSGVILHFANNGDIENFTSLMGISGKPDVLLGDLHWRVGTGSGIGKDGLYHIYLERAFPGDKAAGSASQGGFASEPKLMKKDAPLSPKITPDSVSVAVKTTALPPLKLPEQLFAKNPAEAEKLRAVFSDAPDFVRDIYTKYADFLQDVRVDAKAKSSYYDATAKTLCLSKEAYDTRYAYSILHEFGHHVDWYLSAQRALDTGVSGDAKPLSAFDKEYTDAISLAVSQCKGGGKAKAALKQRMEEAMTGPMAANRAVSDIFCAVTQARSKELFGLYGHSKDYYKNLENVGQEIYANLFQLYANNDKEAIKFLTESFPELFGNVNEAFLKMSGGAGFKFEAAASAKSGASKATDVAAGATTTPVPVAATKAAITLASLPHEKQEALKGMIVDKVPGDYGKETIRDVSTEIINQKRGHAPHSTAPYSLTAEDIMQSYRNSGMTITQAEAEATLNAISLYTSGTYVHMLSAYEKGEAGKRLSKYEKGLRDDFARVIEYTKVAPTYQSAPGEGTEILRGLKGGTDYGIKVKELEVGMIYTPNRPISTTSSLECAQNYAKAPGDIILHFPTSGEGGVVNATSIMGASHLHIEREVLVSDLYWKVVNVVPQADDGRYHIYFERAKPETQAAPAATDTATPAKPKRARKTEAEKAAEKAAKEAEKARKAEEKRLTAEAKKAEREAAKAAEKARKDAEKAEAKRLAAEKKAAEKAEKEAARAAEKARKDAERAAAKATRPRRTPKPKIETPTVANTGESKPEQNTVTPSDLLLAPLPKTKPASGDEAAIRAKVEELRGKVKSIRQAIDDLTTQINEEKDKIKLKELKSQSNKLWTELFKERKKFIKEKVKAAEKGVIFASELAQTLDTVDIDVIIEKIKNAPEDVRKVWNIYEDKMKVSDKACKVGDALFDPLSNSVRFNIVSDRDPKTNAPYFTVFHELGHLIDFNATALMGGMSNNFDGHAFRKALIDDGEKYIADKQTQILNDLLQQGKAPGEAKAEAAKRAYDDISVEILCIPLRAQVEVSDIFAGITLGKVRGQRAHKVEYWQKSTGNLPKEAFANMMSAYICSPESMEHIKKYFPQSFDVFRKMLSKIVEEV